MRPLARLFGLLIVLFAVAPLDAIAGATVVVRAQVSEDLRTIQGEMLVIDGQGLRFVDALSKLEIPTDDELLRRTFPVGVEEGWVRVQEAGQLAGHDRYVFYAIIPRRYDAAGLVPGRGLFMNGLWHPQPVRGDTVPVVAWDVEVAFPPGVMGVLNSAHGEGKVHWAGDGERIGLAAVPDGRAVDISPGVGSAVLIERGPERARRAGRLREALRDGWPGPGAPTLVVVDTPSRLRLARTAPGVLFLSDRAFRLTGPLWQFHLTAVQRGLLQAGLPIADAFDRDLAAAALAAAANETRDPREMLGWLSWIPEIDQLLYEGRLPYYTEVFGETWPEWRVADDVFDVLDPRSPGTAVAQKLDQQFGEDTALRLSWGLARGLDLSTAASGAGVPLAAVQTWRHLPPRQSLTLDVHPSRDGDWDIIVSREADADVPPEPITIELVDGGGQVRRPTWETETGADQTELTVEHKPKSVRVDPDHHVRQDPDARADDRWPHRWTATAAFFPSELAITNRRITADASVALRRQYSTRWVYVGSVGTDPIDLLDLSLGAVRAFGPLQDRRNRPYRFWFGGGPAWLDARFRPTDAGAIALGGYVGMSWETRTDSLFPRHGHRLSLSTSGGFVPTSTLTWSTVSGSGLKVFDLGGRVALVARGAGALALGDVEHRLLTAGLDGLPPQAVVGRQRVTAATELRWQVLRFASVPFPLVWLSDVQLSAGLEAGQITDCVGDLACPARAAGWTAGLGLVGDVLGARPTFLGFQLARMEVWTPEPLVQTRVPQIYIRLTQSY